MKTKRKLIASLITTAFLVSCNANYLLAFAEETETIEAMVESDELISNTDCETSDLPDETNEDTNKESLPEEPITNEESTDLDSSNEEIIDIVPMEDVPTTESSDTNLNSDEILNVIENVEEIESEIENIEIDEYVKIKVDGIQTNGTVLDFNNVTTPTITVNVADEFINTMTVNIQLVNINDTSKTLTYSGRGTNVATINHSSVFGDGIYEISKIELLQAGYSDFYDLTYINPKYQSIVVTPAHNIEFADFSNGFQLVVKNSNPLSFSFENLSVASSIVSNGAEFNPMITIKSNKEITYIHAFYQSSNDSVYVQSSNITKNGDYYTVNLLGMTYAEGYTPVEYLRSGDYSIYSLFINYTETLTDGSSAYYQLTLANTTTAGLFENDGVYDFSALNITCNNPNEDITPPVVTDAFLEKNNAMPGDIIDLKIYVTDDNSGFYDFWQEAYYTWTNENGDEIYGPSSYDSSIGAFKGSAYINKDAKPGVYTLTSTTICDLAYNKLKISEIDPTILAKLTITIGNPNSEDNTDDESNNNNNNNNGGTGDNSNDNNTNNDNSGTSDNNENSSTTDIPTVELKPSTDSTNSNSTSTNTNNTTNTLPQTGDPISSSLFVLFGALSILGGTSLNFKKK